MMIVISLIAGFLFSLGLILSGMTNPDKVIGFLDLFGNWDYSLAFVMGGAVGINAIIFPLVLKRKPLFVSEFSLPSKKDIDKNLVIGAVLFGAGWGILGICPGPGLVNIATLDPSALLFVAAMIVGMLIHKFTVK